MWRDELAFLSFFLACPSRNFSVKVPVPSQYGFMKGSSCFTELISFHCKVICLVVGEMLWILPIWTLVKLSTLFSTAILWRNCLFGWVHCSLGKKPSGWLIPKKWSYIHLAAGHKWAWYWGCFYLISLWMIVRSRWSAPSDSVQVRLGWVGVLISWREESLCRGIWTGSINGLMSIVWGSASQNARSCSWIPTTSCSTTGLGQSGWKSAWHKSTWCVG